MTTKEKEKREALKALANKREQMRLACIRYVKRPIVEMTDAEATQLSAVIATTSANILRLRDDSRPHHQRKMTKAEFDQYQAALLLSIRYFNSRDAEHHAHMHYLAECREVRRRNEERQQMLDAQKKNDIVIHIF